MSLEKQKIVIIWSGSISNPHILNDENILVFQRIGAAGARSVIDRLDFATVSAVIGSPGITAEIKGLVPVPLIAAVVGYMDILETLQYIELRYGIRKKKVALLIHENNRIEESKFDYFINNSLGLYKYSRREDIHGILRHIAEADYECIIGGPSVVSMAGKLNVQAVQLLYNDQSLLDALEKTRDILALMSKEQRQVERLRAVIDVMPNGMIETDHQGTIGMCNRKTLEMLGLPHAEVHGKNVCKLLRDPAWEKVYRDGTAQEDSLITYRTTKFFSTRQPIYAGRQVVGSVGTLQEAAQIQNMETKFRSFQSRGLVAAHTFDDIVGKSPLMRGICERARIYTHRDTTILLEGETGTGKEIFAQSIHNASARHRGPFVAINCAALTESLLESELMGYDEGAFTGAKKQGKAGLFEQAHKGTIFLDEINQLPLHLQAKILRVLQEKAVMHLGGDSVIPIDVRIIAGTNENLRDLIAAKCFRSDLYYRLNVLSILLPPLRERREDIPDLMRAFLARYSVDGEQATLYVDAMCKLTINHDWPGNIRELQNFVERYIALEGRIDELDGHFFHEFHKKTAPSPIKEEADGKYLKIAIDTLENMETALIAGVISSCGGNKSRAALIMDISRSTIYQKTRHVAPVK